MRKIYTLLFAVLFYSGNLISQNSRIWSTYYGGTGDEGYLYTNNVTDASGNVYLVGTTTSTIGIASGGHQNIFAGGGHDAYLVKFDAAGNRLWATYYGGTGDDIGFGVATDNSGNVYISGHTQSTVGISSGGFQNSFSGTQDNFLVKFNTNGVRQWATYYGGPNSEDLGAVAVDPSGNVFLAASTISTVNIASGGFQNSYGGGTYDCYLVKFNSSGSRLWATYYGGTLRDDCVSLTTDASGNVYLPGITSSTNGISSGGFQNTFGGGPYDSFLVKFNTNGTRLWATYYGDATQEGEGIAATDALGNIYMAAYTSSTVNIASGGFQNTAGGNLDAYLVKFDGSGNRLWATYYGGSSSDRALSGLATDGYNNVYLSGVTQSTSGISSGGFQNSFGGGTDAFLVKFNSSGNRISASYYGDIGSEIGYGVSVDPAGKIYLSGNTSSSSNIASGGFQNVFGGVVDAFLVKFDTPCTMASQPGIINGLTSMCAGSGANSYSIATVSGATSYTWSLPSGWSGSSTTNTISATTGTASGNISVSAVNACGTSSASVLSVTVNPLPTITASTNNTLLCTGQTATLTASGASTYTWSPGGAGTSISVSPTVTSTYTINGTDANGCINSSAFTQSVSACTDINQISNSSSDFVVFPNPTTGILNIKGNIGFQIQVYNLLGELVLSSEIKTSNTELNLSQQGNGIYFIKVGTVIKKIIKE